MRVIVLTLLLALATASRAPAQPTSLDLIGRGATGYVPAAQAKAMMDDMLRSLPAAGRARMQKQLDELKAEQTRIGQAYPGHSASAEAPKGAPFTLPAGIELLEITGPAPACIDEAKRGTRVVAGSGQLVGLCMGVRNTTDQPITLTLPAGLIFTSSEPTVQNGILIQDACLEVPPRQTVALLLRAYCLNDQREIPDGSARFTLGPVSTMPALQAVFKTVQGRVIKDSEESYGHFQEMLWVPLRGTKYPFISEKPTQTYFERDRRPECARPNVNRQGVLTPIGAGSRA